MRGRKTCLKCAKPIKRRNTSGMCLPCYNSDPRSIEGKRAAISAARRRLLATNPEFAASQREHGRWLSRNHSAAANAKISPEMRARVGRKYTEKFLGWCPVERRDEYRRMVRNRGFTAVEAKQIILGSLTPFERQMQRVREGAGIVEVRPLRSAEPMHSLVGCGSAMALGG